MHPDLPPDFLALLNQQHGVFTAPQAQRCGLTSDMLRAQVAAHRWQRLGRGLYAAFTGELHRHHAVWAAVLTAGPGASLSHHTAAFRHRLIRDDPTAIHVTVPAERRIRTPQGTALHRSRRVPRVSGSPPTTVIAETVCDLAAAGSGDDQLAAVVSTAVQRGVLTTAQLMRAMDDRGPFRGRASLVALVADATGGAHSALEMRYLRDVERRHGLPRGERQARATNGGRTTRFRDVWYPGQRVTVELDGELFHGSFAARLRDARRDRLAATAGELTLRYGWRDVAGTPCLVAFEVAEVLVARGWTGRMRRCRKCGVLTGL